MPIKLLGADDGTPLAYGGLGYAFYQRFQAVASGSMTLFYVKVSPGYSGNIKCALYADNAGEPGSLITAMNTGQAVTAGWVSVSFTSSAIVSGTYYWLGIIQDFNWCGYTDAGTGTRRYKTETYATFTFPDPPSGLSSDTYGWMVAGWGTAGWANIAKIHGVTATDLAKVDGTVVASISKINGVAV